MGKKIPIKIKPDTIFTAMFEIRFKLAIKETELLGKLYPILTQHFPEMTHKKHLIPDELRGLEPNFRYLADYSFSNAVFSVSLGTNVLVFEYLAGYTGWDDFFANIEKVLTNTDNSGWFSKTERLGLRYINLFDGSTKIEEVLDFPLDVNLEGMVAKNRVFSNQLTADDVTVKVKIAENATLRRRQEIKKGMVIDIDVSKTTDIPPVGIDLLPIVSSLHNREKYVFFNILKQEFIDSRHPEYAN